MWKNKKPYNEGNDEKELTVISKISFTSSFPNHEDVFMSRKSPHVLITQQKHMKKNQIDAGYQCSIFDYDSIITLFSKVSIRSPKEEGKDQMGSKIIAVYKPQKISQLLSGILWKLQTIFSISIILNKSEKFSCKCSILSNSEKFTDLRLLFQIEEKESFIFQYSLSAILQNLMAFFQVDPHQNNLLKLKIVKNQKKLLDFLRKLKISCHYGCYLKMYFENKEILNLFLFNILKATNHPLYSQIKKKTHKSSKIFGPRDRINTEVPKETLPKHSKNVSEIPEQNNPFVSNTQKLKKNQKEMKFSNKLINFQQRPNMAYNKTFFPQAIKNKQENKTKFMSSVIIHSQQKNQENFHTFRFNDEVKKNSQKKNFHKKEGLSHERVNSSKQRNFKFGTIKKNYPSAKSSQSVIFMNKQHSQIFSPENKLLSPIPKYFKKSSTESSAISTEKENYQREEIQTQRKEMEIRKLIIGKT